MLEFSQRVAVRLQMAFYSVRDREEGQGLVEYALIIALVSIALIAALQAMTGALSGVFGRITSVLKGLPA